MTTVADVAAELERIAPLALAEDWDNVGLLMGDPGAAACRVMTCLTVTRETAAEAIAGGAGLVVSHHPILFRPTQRLRADDPGQDYLWALARAGVAVYSPHTAFDNAEGGINALLARKLGLERVGPLVPPAERPGVKVVVFTPETDREAVLDAAFRAGAGRIGAYSECSFAVAGTGTFRGDETTHPAVGQKGRREHVEELRLELICPEARLVAVLAAIRAAHSYEEPAIDVYPLGADGRGMGKGRVGDRPDPVPLCRFVEQVGQALGMRAPQWVGAPDREVRRVAVACGAGDDFLRDAARGGADVLVTGEARFHRALEAKALGVGLVLAGHHATERPGVEELARELARRLPGLDVWASREEVDPLRT